MDIHFRWNRKSAYSLAALAPLIKGACFSTKPENGIMIYSFSTKQSEMFFDEVKRAKTDSIFIAGGPHPSGEPEQTLEYFDYVVIGEGEDTLPHLVQSLLSGSSVEHVKGIACRSEDGRIFYTGQRDQVELDRYPCFDPQILFSPIEISRGCPWNCRYCQTPNLFGNEMRHRSISSILKCARHYSDLRFTSSNAFAYGSDGITPRYDKVEKLLTKLNSLDSRNIYFGTFPSEVRPEFVTDRALELIVEYCTNSTINMGAQSGSPRMLNKMSRGHNVDDIVIAVERCIDHAISPVVDFIVGLPDETDYDQEQSIDLIKWICSRGGKVRAHHFTPLPGTGYCRSQPSQISRNTKKILGKLALDGKVTGSWER
ncbi:Radical SAM domain protein [Methanosalsum zhilinae DSM 4017]|uniref:Radical SAM domain protein n=1 Tax=Methanosalsum zhilinae (strain DSM 4017 / NBRC 107636 / OCM 62 / WeN5) TaxID=679901 RepID=F7XP81_METZD|nr:TIGR04013 family B12-binding domain/radical SAM domain-containing protein [Methanosalsum zhilinae]AEH61376.1 Radical SAM domain protein [Methanosalsum zhilinae DSM 4017]